MKRVDVLRMASVWLAVLGLCLPPSALAAAGGGQTPAVVDVKLAEGGVFYGQVVDSQAMALAKVPVSLWRGQRRVAVAETDAAGYFAVGRLQGGVYRVVAADGSGTFRLWTPGSSPPLCEQGALIVSGRDTVRGNFSLGFPGSGALGFWLSNPTVAVAVAGAAIAVPLALHDWSRPASP